MSVFAKTLIGDTPLNTVFGAATGVLLASGLDPSEGQIANLVGFFAGLILLALGILGMRWGACLIANRDKISVYLWPLLAGVCLALIAPTYVGGHLGYIVQDSAESTFTKLALLFLALCWGAAYFFVGHLNRSPVNNGR